MRATRLIFVRHGESNVTVEQIVGGARSCTGLSPLGVRQAVALRDRLARESVAVDVLLSSTLPRARETTEVIQPVLGAGITFVEDLEEQRPGAADGCPFVDFDARFGMFDFRAEPDRPMAPGGESLREFHERVARTLREIEADYAGLTVMAVCHGGVIDVAFREYLSIGLAGEFDLWTLNTSLTEFHFTHRQPRPQLRRYNDAAHIADLPPKTEL